MRRTLHRMRQIDRAWNDRNWDDYASLLADELIAYASGEHEPHGKQEHIARARNFCETFPDSRLHIDPYMELFAAHDGSFSCSVARITGTASGDLTMPDGLTLAPVHHSFDVTLTAVCRWKESRVVEQHRFLDMELMMRQLRNIPQKIRGGRFRM